VNNDSLILGSMKKAYDKDDKTGEL